MARSTTTRPQAPKTRHGGKPLHTRRDLSIKLRRSWIDPYDGPFATPRAKREAIGFADDWDQTDQAAAALDEIFDDMFAADLEELRELDLERRARERQALADLMEIEDSLERPCTCIGPCFYGSALHPTKKEKEMFATAIATTDSVQSRNAAARRLILGKPKLNPAAGKQFRPEPVKGNPGAPGRKGRARIVTGGSI